MVGVRAVVRVRPFVNSEPTDQPVVFVQGNKIVVNQRTYGNFYAALDGNCSQEEAFQRTGIIEYVKAALEGYSSTILAYGQTGSGKTHSLMGNGDGLVPRAVQALFAETLVHPCETRGRWCIRASYCEIGNAPGAVNERITDLLAPKSLSHLQLRHGDDGPFVADLTAIQLDNFEDALEVLAEGQRNRRTSQHALNSDSSRTHSFFTLFVKQDSRRIGKITFVDLAGSERLKATEAAGLVRKETQAINKSLFTLGQVILAQSEGKFIPYRNSKLTELLQDSLGANSLCLMITCLSPNNEEESKNSLLYATRAMNIDNQPLAPIWPTKEIDVLREENRRYRETYGPLPPHVPFVDGPLPPHVPYVYQPSNSRPTLPNQPSEPRPSLPTGNSNKEPTGNSNMGLTGNSSTNTSVTTPSKSTTGNCAPQTSQRLETTSLQTSFTSPNKSLIKDADSPIFVEAPINPGSVRNNVESRPLTQKPPIAPVRKKIVRPLPKSSWTKTNVVSSSSTCPVTTASPRNPTYAELAVRRRSLSRRPSQPIPGSKVRRFSQGTPGSKRTSVPPAEKGISPATRSEVQRETYSSETTPGTPHSQPTRGRPPSATKYQDSPLTRDDENSRGLTASVPSEICITDRTDHVSDIGSTVFLPSISSRSSGDSRDSLSVKCTPVSITGSSLPSIAEKKVDAKFHSKYSSSRRPSSVTSAGNKCSTCGESISDSSSVVSSCSSRSSSQITNATSRFDTNRGRREYSSVPATFGKGRRHSNRSIGVPSMVAKPHRAPLSSASSNASCGRETAEISDLKRTIRSMTRATDALKYTNSGADRPWILTR